MDFSAATLWITLVLLYRSRFAPQNKPLLSTGHCGQRAAAARKKGGSKNKKTSIHHAIPRAPCKSKEHYDLTLLSDSRAFFNLQTHKAHQQHCLSPSQSAYTILYIPKRLGRDDFLPPKLLEMWPLLASPLANCTKTWTRWRWRQAWFSFGCVCFNHV